MDNSTETDKSKNNQSWLITAILFIILFIIVSIICGYLGYKLYYCKTKPNAVVFID